MRVNDIVRDFGTWKILFSLVECAENRMNQTNQDWRFVATTLRTNNCVYLTITVMKAKEREGEGCRYKYDKYTRL